MKNVISYDVTNESPQKRLCSSSNDGSDCLILQIRSNGGDSIAISWNGGTTPVESLPLSIGENFLDLTNLIPETSDHMWIVYHWQNGGSDCSDTLGIVYFPDKTEGTLQIVETVGVTSNDSYIASYANATPGTTTPVIGENGDWYISGKDTGKPSRGEKGDKGDKGDTGETGAAGIPGADGAPGAKGDKGDPGEPGADGGQGSKGDKGDKGDPGTNGTDGVSVESVTQTAASRADSGKNTFAVRLSNGTVSSFDYYNGSKGSTGEKGDKGDTGATGAKGDTGEKGDKGDKGDPGSDANLDSLKIGGTNLITGSGLIGSDGVYKSLNVKKLTASTSSGTDWMLRQFYTEDNTIDSNSRYVFSFYAKASTPINMNIYFYPAYENGAYKDNANTVSLTTEWVRYSVGFNSYIPNNGIGILFRVWQGTSDVYLSGYKLEKGTVATEWSPAPEDNPTTAQGSWTPKFYKSDGKTEVASTVNSSQYFRVGNLVHIWAEVKPGDVYDCSNMFMITGLPFPPVYSCGVRVGGFDYTSTVRFYVNELINALVRTSNIPQGTPMIYIEGSYITEGY